MTTLTCPACHGPLYPHLARRTDDGWRHASCPREARLAKARADHKAALDAANADRLEDIAWMAATGENASGAAARLGLSRDGLEHWCRRHAPQLWPALREREPRDHNRMRGAAA